MKLQPLLREEHEEDEEEVQLIELTELDSVDEDVLYDAFMTVDPVERDLTFYGHDLRRLCSWDKLSIAFKTWKGTAARACKVTGLFYIPESKELRVLGTVHIGPPAQPHWFHFVYDKSNVTGTAGAVASEEGPDTPNTVDMRKFIDQLHLNS